jgi:hypothetical protein
MCILNAQKKNGTRRLTKESYPERNTYLNRILIGVLTDAISNLHSICSKCRFEF